MDISKYFTLNWNIIEFLLFYFTACLDTIIQNMEIVSRYGPRKHLPPDNVLESFIVSQMYFC